MFYGEYSHQLDAKNRIRIPFRFKGELGEKYVFTLKSDGVVSIYPERMIEEKFGFLKNISPFDEELNEFAQNFFSGFYTADEDAQGRVMIPSELRQEANLDKDVVTVGMGDHLDLMSKTKREAIRKKISRSELMAKMDKLFKANELIKLNDTEKQDDK